MAEEDIPYYEARAEQELSLARQASHPAAVQAHYALAACYLDLIRDRPLAVANPSPPMWQ